MIKARSYYDREKIENMAKAMQKKTIWHSLILSIILLIMGIVNIVSFFLDDYNWFSLIVGVAATAFAVYPIVAGIKTNKNSVKKAVEDMGVQNGPVEIIYEFKEKRAEISVTRDGATQIDTLMYKYIDYAKLNKEGIGIYFTNGDMYFIYNDDFVEGNRANLISLLTKNKITVK